MKIHVMTLCTGYSYPIFQRFVGSLYDTGFSGSCYIFCQERDLPILEKLRKEYPNVVAVPCDLSRFNTHMQSSRFKYMTEFLQEDLDYDYLFICDSRDVLFQKNIEEFPLKGDLYAFEEEQIIGNCRFNSTWIRDVERVLGRQIPIQYKTIICSGTLLVSKQKALHFLDSFSSLLLNPVCSRNCGVDQGVYNYFCHENPLDLDITFSSNTDNLVNTIGYGHKEVLGSKIVNAQQEVSYVVHQYDRMMQDQRKDISVKYDFCV
jgi:hypothetical protein